MAFFLYPTKEDGSPASWRTIMIGVWVLTLSTVGNAILPIPYAFAITGAVASTLIIVFVALSNVYTCRLLLRGATCTGAADYEQLAFAVGGKWFKLWAEVWITLLLMGTNIGGIIQMGEAFSTAVSLGFPGAPSWLSWNNGFYAMLFFTLVVILPLCMLPQMKKLEAVGAVASLILWALMIIVVVYAIQMGLPALGTPDFPAVSSGCLDSVSTTFSLLCFAFYHQVMMMPLLSEMPRVSTASARQSAKDLGTASAFCILVTSGLTYWMTGFFGASAYGASNIAENLTQNWWFVHNQATATFILNLFITIYLSLAIPPIFHANNHTVHYWLMALFPRIYGGLPAWGKRLAVNCCTILPCLAVALGVPGSSGIVLTVTGATGVSMCSYMLPVVIHFTLFFGKARCQRVSATPGRTASGAPPELQLNSSQPPVLSAVLPLVHGGGGDAPFDGAAADVDSPTAGDAAFAGKIGKDDLAMPAGGGDGDGAMVPHPDAPPGLMWCYRKPRPHWAVTAAYDVVLPILVLSLGCFFSVTTLVELWKPCSCGC